MKKIFATLIFATLSTGMFAQEGFKIGLQGGIPLGDFDDQLSLVVALDVGYMWALGGSPGLVSGQLNPAG